MLQLATRDAEVRERPVNSEPWEVMNSPRLVSISFGTSREDPQPVSRP